MAYNESDSYTMQSTNVWYIKMLKKIKHDLEISQHTQNNAINYLGLTQSNILNSLIWTIVGTRLLGYQGVILFNFVYLVKQLRLYNAYDST